MLVILVLIFAVITLLFCLKIYHILQAKWVVSYWKKKGLQFKEEEKGVKPISMSMADRYLHYYRYFKDRGLKHGMIYKDTFSFYMPVDPYIIKNILVRDFSHFIDRGLPVNVKRDPLEGHLFNMEGEKWKNLRSKLTPTFTSGKMKMMFSTMIATTKGLINVLDDYAKTKECVDIKDVVSRFTTDVIGSVVFGIECNSLNDPNNDFRVYGKKIFDVPVPQFKDKLKYYIPQWILETVGFTFKATNPDVENFFLNIIKSTVDYRETNKVFRKDFLHLLLQLKNLGRVTDDEHLFDEGNQNKGADLMTFNEIAAQSYVFFLAGYETSATTMTFAFLELAANPDIQEKLREEIFAVLKENKEITYEAILNMKYLDKVINETLRRYPPIAMLLRKCIKDYQIPDTSITLDKGTTVLFSPIGIHMDPEYYPNPEKFDPERFSEENKAQRPPCTFLAFGEGPRNCIGSRFGQLQAKVGIVSILKNFQVSLNKRTKYPIKISAKTFILSVEGDVWLDVSKLD